MPQLKDSIGQFATKYNSVNFKTEQAKLVYNGRSFKINTQRQS